MGLIYQFYNLIPTLDVRQNILLPVLLDGRSRMRKASVSLRIHWGLPIRLHHARAAVRRPAAARRHRQGVDLPARRASGG